jgi:hypothetical protein
MILDRTDFWRATTVQKTLRHTDPKITSEVCGHLDLEDLRAGLNRLALGLPPPPELPPFAATLLLGAASPIGEGPDATRFPGERPGLRLSGRLDLNQRPLAP